MNKTKILVTGSTGNLAPGVISLLRAKNVDVRAFLHTESKGQSLKDLGCELAVGDLADKAAVAKAVDGVSAIFLLTPASPDAAMWASNVITAAKASPLKPRIVRISGVGVGPNAISAISRLHAVTEQELVDSGLAYSILRPNFFMQAAFLAAQSIAAQGAMYWGTGEAKMAFIDLRDLAEVATNLLLDSSWDRGIYYPTGPTPLSFHDAAKILTTALGKEVKYVPVPPDAVHKALMDMGAGEWLASGIRDISKAFGNGMGDFTTSHVEKITGHKPRSYESFATEVFAPATKR
jgi:uncharacterized protein YbjT (DUF2867 family)